jgi:hypothetical protein
VKIKIYCVLVMNVSFCFRCLANSLSFYVDFFIKFYNTDGVSEQRYLHDSNDAASHTSTSVARLLRVWMLGASQIVFALVQNHGTANNAAWTDQCDDRIGEAGVNYAI